MTETGFTQGSWARTRSDEMNELHVEPEPFFPSDMLDDLRRETADRDNPLMKRRESSWYKYTGCVSHLEAPATHPFGVALRWLNTPERLDYFSAIVGDEVAAVSANFTRFEPGDCMGLHTDRTDHGRRIAAFSVLLSAQHRLFLRGFDTLVVGDYHAPLVVNQLRWFKVPTPHQVVTIGSTAQPRLNVAGWFFKGE